MSNTLSLDDLKKQFAVNPREASAFLLLLAQLEPGDVLKSPVMRVVKGPDDTFKLFMETEDVEGLVKDLSEITVDPLMAMMESSGE